MKPIVEYIQTTEEAIALMREKGKSDRVIRRTLELTGRQFKRLTRADINGISPIGQAGLDLTVRYLNARHATSGAITPSQADNTPRMTP